jgi:hypothetical protein
MRTARRGLCDASHTRVVVTISAVLSVMAG